MTGQNAGATNRERRDVAVWLVRQACAVPLIDAANVVGSRPTGWWRDRPGAVRELTTRIRRAAAEGMLPCPAVLVLEGEARKRVEEGLAEGVEVVHAPGHGDDTLATLAAEANEKVLVVSADRVLAERVRPSGVDILSPAWLLDRLPS